MKKTIFASMLLVLSSGLHAATLSDLVAGGSLSSGGVTVSGFSFVRNCSGTGVCAPLDASGISVDLTPDGHLAFAGGFSALSVNGVATADFLVGYDLATTYKVNQIGLLFNGAVVGDQSFAQVVETAIVPGPFIAGQGQVDAPGGPLSVLIALSGDYNLMRIVKDIFLVGSASDGLGYATISMIDQYYPGGDTDTPEPATYAMLGTALIGGYFVKRTRRAS